MSNFLKNILSSNFSSKDLSQKEIDEQRTSFSDSNDVTNELIIFQK